VFIHVQLRSTTPAEAGRCVNASAWTLISLASS